MNSRFQEAIELIKRKRQRTAEEIAIFVEAEAKKRVSVKTGDTRRRITHVTKHEENVSKIKVGSNLEHVPSLEEGSKPHKIKRNDGIPLRIKIDGHWVTVDEVNHPGTKAQPFLRPAITENIEEIQERIRRGMIISD